MTKPVIVEEQPINSAKLKAELEKIQKRDGELNYRANKTLEYLNQFVTLGPKKADELYKKLTDLNIPRLKENHIHKIIDTLPDDVEGLKVVLQGYPISVTQDSLKKIVAVVQEYAE